MDRGPRQLPDSRQDRSEIAPQGQFSEDRAHSELSTLSGQLGEEQTKSYALRTRPAYMVNDGSGVILS